MYITHTRLVTDMTGNGQLCNNAQKAKILARIIEKTGQKMNEGNEGRIYRGERMMMNIERNKSTDEVQHF